MPKNKQQEKKDQKKNSEDTTKFLRDTDTDPDTSNPSPGSMSEGNLSNNVYGRERRSTPHRKMFITGSDNDGQAV
jgi:hypothetical protein